MPFGLFSICVLAPPCQWNSIRIRRGCEGDSLERRVGRNQNLIQMISLNASVERGLGDLG
jgi:hypothetical protein